MMFFRRPTAQAATDQDRESGAGAGTGAPGAASRGADPDAAVLDADSLARLRELDPRGEAHLIQKVVEAFCNSTGRMLPQLVEAARLGDLKGVRHVAHTLKSSSASLGALRLSALCGDLENQIRVDEVKGLDRQIEQIAAEIEVVIKALDVLMNSAQ